VKGKANSPKHSGVVTSKTRSTTMPIVAGHNLTIQDMHIVSQQACPAGWVEQAKWMLMKKKQIDVEREGRDK
jgi:hypothetical protein